MVLRPVWRDPTILGLMAGQILVWSAFFYSFPALTLAWQAEFGWPLPQVMGAFSVALIAMAMVAPVAGRLIDKGLAATLMLAGTLAGAVALGGVALGPGLLGFYLAWLIIGICMGATLYEPTFAILLRTRGEEAREAITAISIVAGFASLLTFPLVHWLTEAFDWRAAPTVFAVLLVLVAAPLLWRNARRLETEAGAAPQTPTQDTPETIAPYNPAIRRLMVVFILPALASGLVLSQVLPLLTLLGYSSAAAVAIAAWIGPMQVLARLATSGFGRVRTASIVIVALLSLGSGSFVLWIGAPGLAAAIAFLVTFGAGNGLVGIMRPVVVREVLGAANLGANTGAVARPALLAVAVAPFLGGVLITEAGPSALLLLAGGTPFAAAFLFTRLRSHGP